MAAVTEHVHHPVAISGPSPQQPGAPAVLVDVEADDFVTTLNDAITGAHWPRFGWPGTFAIPRLPDAGGPQPPRALFQPIHRRFNLVLLDTHCALFGTPRLDPRKIESSGFVVRRWIGPATPDDAALADPRNWQAWQDSEGGWRGFTNAAAFDADPEPARRPAPRTGSAVVDARLAALRGVLPAEAVNPLHALLPEVNAHARRSLLWGVVPTGDARRMVEPTAVDYRTARVAGPDRDAFVDHLSPWLSRPTLRPMPGAGSRFDASWLNGSDPLDAGVDDLPPGAGDALLREQFVAFVRQLASEFDLNGRGAALLPLFDQIAIGWQRNDGLRRWRVTAPAREFVAGCVRVVTDPDASPVDLPDDFGPVPAGWTERFADAALDVLAARAADARTLVGRFDDAASVYAIRAFIRVRGEPGCPTRLVWSAMTPRYSVAPWYASTGAPQARIALPAFDRASLAAMKPNVAFEVPPALQNLLMRNKPEDLLKAPKDGGEIGLGWICSFSIPIITICAFILLNVVLALLNLVFFWLPLVKICLPIPKRK